MPPKAVKEKFNVANIIIYILYPQSSQGKI